MRIGIGRNLNSNVRERQESTGYKDNNISSGQAWSLTFFSAIDRILISNALLGPAWLAAVVGITVVVGLSDKLVHG
jgi:hypothetical protein